MTALATSNVSSKNDVSIVTLPLHTTTRLSDSTSDERKATQTTRGATRRSDAADVGEGQAAEGLGAAPFPPTRSRPRCAQPQAGSMRRTRRKGGERHLSTSAGIIFPSSASITCCQVFVEFGMTKPKSKSHSSMHCPCRKIRCSSRNLSISSTCGSTWVTRLADGWAGSGGRGGGADGGEGHLP